MELRAIRMPAVHTAISSDPHVARSILEEGHHVECGERVSDPDEANSVRVHTTEGWQLGQCPRVARPDCPVRRFEDRAKPPDSGSDRELVALQLHQAAPGPDPQSAVPGPTQRINSIVG